MKKRKEKLKSAVCSCMAVKSKKTRRPTVGLVKYRSKSPCNGTFQRLKRARSRTRRPRSRSRSPKR